MRQPVAVVVCLLTGLIMAVSLAGGGQASKNGTMTSMMLRTAWGDPDLRGTWSQATLTPLERPKELADKEFLTEHEAAEYAKTVMARQDADAGRQIGSARDLALGTNDFWFDRGTEVTRSRRTSLVVDRAQG